MGENLYFCSVHKGEKKTSFPLVSFRADYPNTPSVRLIAWIFLSRLTLTTSSSSLHGIDPSKMAFYWMSQPMALAPRTAAEAPSSPLMRNFALPLKMFWTWAL